VPLNPLTDVTVIVEFSLEPFGIVREEGSAEIEKSGVGGGGVVYLLSAKTTDWVDIV